MKIESLIGSHVRVHMSGANGFGGGGEFKGRLLSYDDGLLEVENIENDKRKYQGNHMLNKRLVLFIQPVSEKENNW